MVWHTIAWFTFVLTTILVYLAAVGYAVAIGFVDTVCSLVYVTAEGPWCALDDRLTACIIEQEGL